ncbi:hypothetical protein DERP_005848 [Dermatophagoides pteronyssinus]|uniref:Uncharacterized protein n=1 Tax=Dermatophagoides pteronyssinus TaxID=6956 RepID=A0ABQ8J9V0_DERPT|nr:hypothetical protein DERP_005848 [Dermatophagoides pteronyssinus]
MKISVLSYYTCYYRQAIQTKTTFEIQQQQHQNSNNNNNKKRSNNFVIRMRNFTSLSTIIPVQQF